MAWRVLALGRQCSLVVVLVVAAVVGAPAAGAASGAAAATTPRSACALKAAIRWEGPDPELTLTFCPAWADEVARVDIASDSPVWYWTQRLSTQPATRVDLGELFRDETTSFERIRVWALDADGAQLGAFAELTPAPPFTDTAAMYQWMFATLAPGAVPDPVGVDPSSPLHVADALLTGSYWRVRDPVVRLYRAAFLRVPDRAGLEYWVARRRSGTSLAKVAAGFAASPELRARYGTLSDRDFVTQIYLNVLGRAGEAAGVHYWTDQLARKTRTRGDVLAGFSESPEHRTRTEEVVSAVSITTGLLDRMPTAAEVGGTRGDLLRTALASPDLTRRVDGDIPPLPTLSAADIGVTGDGPYDGSFSASFATGTVTYAVTGGTLPAGLSLSPGGQLSGTPAVGHHRVQISATDATATTGSTWIDMEVRPTLTGIAEVDGSCRRSQTGEVVCAGANDLGQLGDGTTTSRATTFAPVLGLGPAIDLASGPSCSCAVRTTGEVLCWGAYGTPAQARPTPAAVAGITDAERVTVGGAQSCALLEGGAVRCWTEAAPGDPAGTPAPIAIPAARSVSAAVADTCAGLVDGTVRCWGQGTGGQLGDGLTTSSATPVVVSDLTDTVEVVAHGTFTSCALRGDGTIWCWGATDTFPTNGAVPTMQMSGATALGGADDVGCALVAEGRMRCWGAIYFLEGGSGTFWPFYGATTIQGIVGATTLSGLSSIHPGGRVRRADPFTWAPRYTTGYGSTSTWLYG